MKRQKAPELVIEKWLNTEHSWSIHKLQGDVIALHTFQMLCPACILHALPQAERLYRFFAPKGLRLLAIHTVFENHKAMQEHALRVFLNEFSYTFPVAIDKHEKKTPGEIPLPQTMQLYGCRGTPSLILIDRFGDIRKHYFGQVEDMVLSHEITKLIEETSV